MINEPLTVSLFQLLREKLGLDLRLIRCTKATLVHVSHLVEDLILRNAIPAMIFTGFQESSHWRKETERYRALAEVVQQVCIFAGGTLPPESSARELHVTLAGPDPLRQEWFLAVLSERFSVVLCGQDRLEPTDDPATRQFDTIWSFEPTIINSALDQLEQAVTRYRPERLDLLIETRRTIPLQAPDATLMTIFTQDLITFEEDIHQRLAAAAALLEQQMLWRAQLTEALVHDLRTPLQGLTQTIEFLRTTEDLDPAITSEMLQLASLSADSMADLVQLLLDTSRLENEYTSVKKAPVAPRDIVSGALALLGPLLGLSQLNLEHAIDPKLKLILCDRMLLTRVVQNLIGNAIKYTSAGGTIRLDLGFAPSGKQVEIRVRDNGFGIPIAALPHIFDRYYRALRSERQGSGNGLYFWRLAVEAHQGTVRADSLPGMGTTITVSLPLR